MSWYKGKIKCNANNYSTWIFQNSCQCLTFSSPCSDSTYENSHRKWKNHLNLVLLEVCDIFLDLFNHVLTDILILLLKMYKKSRGLFIEYTLIELPYIFKLMDVTIFIPHNIAFFLVWVFRSCNYTQNLVKYTLKTQATVRWEYT